MTVKYFVKSHSFQKDNYQSPYLHNCMNFQEQTLMVVNEMSLKYQIHCLYPQKGLINK